MSNTAALATVQTTNVKGYFNGNKWPIHVGISELNVTLTLKPGQFVETADHRKINDPLFEAYTKPFQLNKELSPTPVPLITVPRPTATTTGNGHVHSVSAVSKYAQDAHGIRHPVIPTQKPQAVPTANSSSLKVMTMEEARNLGYVGKARPVSEDYGAEDSGHGVGNAQSIPEIKVAMESNPRIRTQGQLPPELLAGNIPAQNAALVSNLQQTLVKTGTGSAQVEMPGSATGYINEARQNLQAPAQSSIIMPSAPPPIDQVLLREAAEAEAAAAESLPAPNIFNPDQIAQVQVTLTAPPTPVSEASTRKPAAPVKSKAPAAPVRTAAPKVEKPFVCPVCNQPHKYRSNLINHAKAKHLEQLEAIEAQFPETA
jgi:hypothetical protein